MNPPEPDVKAIFGEALERAAGPERAAYLDGACRDDAAVRGQVESLLIAHDQAGGFLGSADGATVDHARSSDDDPTVSVHRPIAEGPGTTIGPYKLLQKIGEGGMGTVFMAEQERPVRRKVALKVIKPGMDTAQVIARFEAERQALAIMDHPNIARVLDVGATETGRPFFVMELVKGVPITEYCDRNNLTPKERLELFIPVCQAIQHAHQKGIIHRDIKPSNVLVTLHDGKPVPKVIDFGVAKAIDQRLTERTMFTEFGAIIGTLEYMSPEQAEMGALDIDTRSDIYSLGVLLYELLTGSTPLERAKLRKAAYSEIIRRIREEEPPKPSTRLSESKDTLPSISAQRRMEPARLTKLVRGDLDWIVMKSLEKDRTRRYETATGFARDIQRYLDGDPVEACPPSATYKLRKFAHKHSAALATAGAFAILLIAATAISVGLALWANRERVRAVDAEKLAKVQKARAQDREQMAIDAVRRYGDVVRDTPELKNTPALAKLRATLLKEPHEFFKTLRDRLQADRETTPESLGRLAAASFDLGILTNEIGDKREALRAYEESLSILEPLSRENVLDSRPKSGMAAIHNNIGILQQEMGRTAEAIISYERARGIQEKLARENPSITEYRSGVALGHYNIGTLQSQMDRKMEALASHEQALAIRKRLAQENPSDIQLQNALAMSHNGVGNVLRAMDRPTEALASQEWALAIFERLVKENPSVTTLQSALAGNLQNIGILERAMGRSTEALASQERALAIRQRLVRENPSVTTLQNDLAMSWNSIALQQVATGQTAKALSSFEKALAIRHQLVRENPLDTRFQIDLAAILNKVGVLQGRMGRTEEALTTLLQLQTIQERLASENPSSIHFQSDLAKNLNEIGSLQRQTHRPVEALASHERALAIRERLARENPDSAGFASDLGATLSNMAMNDLDQQRFEQARDKLMLAIESQRKALAVSPNHPNYRQFLANHLTNLIRAAEGLGRVEEAAEARRELAEFTANDPAKAALDARLRAVLGGQPLVSDAERIQLAYRAYEKTQYATSARLFAEALANDPKLGNDRQSQHRYNAACAAALAASDQGKDAPPPDDGAKAKLRGQALQGLQAELSAWKRLGLTIGPGNKETVAKTLQHWKADTDLAGIRDPKQLAKLPEAERSEFQRLWSEVDKLLTSASGGK